MPKTKQKASKQAKKQNNMESTLCWPTTPAHGGLRWSFIDMPIDTLLGKKPWSSFCTLILMTDRFLASSGTLYLLTILSSDLKL